MMEIRLVRVARRPAGGRSLEGFVRGIELMLGLLVDAARLLELGGTRRAWVPVLVFGDADDPLLEQSERRMGGLRGLEHPGAEVVIAAQRLEPPGIEIGRTPHDASADQIARAQPLLRAPAGQALAGPG